jgi:hypothetical protein
MTIRSRLGRLERALRQREEVRRSQAAELDKDRWLIDLILSHPEGPALLTEFHEIGTRVEAEHRAKLARCPAALVDWVPPGDLDCG